MAKAAAMVTAEARVRVGGGSISDGGCGGMDGQSVTIL